MAEFPLYALSDYRQSVLMIFNDLIVVGKAMEIRMDFADNICMNCFEKLTAGSVCAQCGFDNDKITPMLYLQRKTVLASRYAVGNVINEESDAVTYIGYDMQKDAVVTIREFLPKGIANRLEGNNDVHIRERFRKNYNSYKAEFIKLWQTLRSMNALSAVIPVLDVFEANQTAYAVCEKTDYVTLHDFLLKTDENNILWDKARLMFMPVLTTLENLHSNGIIHGGINPDNLVLCRDGKVRLAGFCINECNHASSEMEFNVHEGYTALEQYENNHKVCPATDIYAFSACIYRALVGTNPPDAVSRESNDKLMIPNRIAEKIPAHVIKALGGGLQIYPEKRIQTIYDYRELLNAAPSVVAKSATTSQAGEDVKRTDPAVQEAKQQELHRAREAQREAKRAEKEKKKKITKLIIALVVLVAVAAGAFYAVNTLGLLEKETTTAPTTLANVTVPDFSSVGYAESDIKNNGPWNAQFKITFEYAYSSDVEEGIVFKQSIAQGETVTEGTAIVLTVSKGVETANVPDVGGLMKDEAVSKLEAEGFEVKIVTVYNDGTYTEGKVKSNYGMAPSAGSTVAKGEEVLIQVYGVAETTTEPPSETVPAQ